MKNKDTVGYVLELLKGIPPETKLLNIEIEETEFIFSVDSSGVARKVVTKRTKWLSINLRLDMQS